MTGTFRSGLQLDTERRRVEVSAIFKWFDDDFDATGGVRIFLTRYAPKTKITFLDDDWSLNEAQGD